MAAAFRPPAAAAAAAAVLVVLAATAAALLEALEPADARHYSRFPCRISGSMLAAPATDGDGNVRGNPDGTQYPGDAFEFEARFTFNKYCSGRSVSAVSDSGAVEVLSQRKSWSGGASVTTRGTAEIGMDGGNACHGGDTYSGGRGGWSSWWGAPRDCGKVEQTAQGKYRKCSPVRCYTVTVTRTVSHSPQVIAPVLEAPLWVHRSVLDPDGYASVNRDGTYYPWDPVVVEHAPKFLHRDARHGTISFTADAAHAPLAREAWFTCDSGGGCADVLRPPPVPAGTGWTPYGPAPEDPRGPPAAYGNGAGMGAYTAPGAAEAGKHTIVYALRAYNEGRLLNTVWNSTAAEIVEYHPAYLHYAYPVLGDRSHRAYDDRQAVVLHYLGSAGAPGLDPDPNRRSKITNFRPATNVTSEQHAGLPAIAVDPSLMTWNSTAAAGGPAPPGEAPAFSSLGDGPCGTRGAADRHERPGCHAMFTGEGYGVVRFLQGISGIVTGGENRYLAYDNATTVNVLASDGWGGRLRHDVMNYTYRYPHAALAQHWNATAYGAAGSPSSGGPPVAVYVHASPTHGRADPPVLVETGSATAAASMHVSDYLWAKALRDTGDPHMADAVEADSAPDSVTESGAGAAHAWVHKMVLSWRNNALLAKHGSDSYDVLDMPLHEALHMPATVQVDVSSNTTNSYRTEFDFKGGHHTRIYPHAVDCTGDACPDGFAVQRAGDGQSVRFHVPYWFGRVSHASHAGGGPQEIGDECHGTHSCEIRTDGAGGTVTVASEWGGTLAAAVTSQDRTVSIDDPEDSAEDVYGLLIITAPMIVFAALLYVVYRVARHGLWDGGGEPRGAGG